MQTFSSKKLSVTILLCAFFWNFYRIIESNIFGIERKMITLFEQGLFNHYLKGIEFKEYHVLTFFHRMGDLMAWVIIWFYIFSIIPSCYKFERAVVLFFILMLLNDTAMLIFGYTTPMVVSLILFLILLFLIKEIF